MHANLRRLVLLVVLCSTGCGGGSGTPGDALPGALPPPTPPEGPATTNLVEDQSVYSHPGIDLVDMYVTIRPADNLEVDEDTDCPFVNNSDGLGTTLADVHQDLDGSDNCKPELNVVLDVAGLVDAGGAANAEMRIRGSSSRFAQQKSYRIKLNSKQAADHWRGQRTLQLNKQPYDLTRLRNKLSFDLFIDIPHMTSLRTQFVRLFVDQQDGNGFVDFGMYTQVEKLDDYCLASHGLDPAGTVYKTEFFEFERYENMLKLESDPTFDVEAFESILEIKEGSGDHAPLLAMLDAVNDETNDFAQVFSTYFNQQNYLTWLACNILFDNLDTNSQNFFLYRRDDASVFYFMPWDYDGAWDFWGQPKQLGVDGPARWNEGLANWWNGKLHQRFFKQPGAAALLTAKMQEIRSNYATAVQVQALLDSYAATADAELSHAPDLWDLPALDDSTQLSITTERVSEVARLAGLIESSYQQYVDTLERPMPVYMGANIDGPDVRFTWEASFDLQGDPITYDFVLSTTPTFEPGNTVTQGMNLTGTSFQVPLAVLPAGEYFYRVVIRDTKSPSTNWQIPFETYFDATDKAFHGVARLLIP